MKMRGRTIVAPEERIKAAVKINPETQCWEWTRAVKSGKSPYGRLTVGRRTISAHRYSYNTFRGDIPPGICVCHHCDNPRCVNPDHLFLGTKKDNADDRDRKGRNVKGPVLRGEKGTNAKLSNAEVAQIRASKLSSSQLSALYKIDASHIRALRRGKYFSPPPSSES